MASSYRDYDEALPKYCKDGKAKSRRANRPEPLSDKQLGPNSQSGCPCQLCEPKWQHFHEMHGCIHDTEDHQEGKVGNPQVNLVSVAQAKKFSQGERKRAAAAARKAELSEGSTSGATNP